MALESKRDEQRRLLVDCSLVGSGVMKRCKVESIVVGRKRIRLARLSAGPCVGDQGETRICYNIKCIHLYFTLL